MRLKNFSKLKTTYILIKNEMTSFLDYNSDSSMFISATLKDRFFRSDLDKGFARVRSKVESVVFSRSLDLGDSDLVDGSRERNGMPIVSGPVLPQPDQAFLRIQLLIRLFL